MKSSTLKSVSAADSRTVPPSKPDPGANMQPGDTVTFEHPITGKPVVGKLVAIVDGFYIVDDGVTRPLHRLPMKYATLFNFRVVPEQSSHAE